MIKSPSQPLTLSQQIIYWLRPLQKQQFKSINFLKLEAYWNVGLLLSQNILAEKMSSSLKQLNEDIAQELPQGYSANALRDMLNFNKAYPEYEQVHPELSWTHYRTLIRLKNAKARLFYTKEAALHHWNLAALKRNIKALHFERLEKTAQQKHTEFIPQLILKDLYILEFLQLANQKHILEKDLEDGLLEKLQNFLMELGEGFAFVARQKRIVTVTGKQFFIDLVFYHFTLKRFILIELKVTDLSHRDIGQLDMYVRLFDEKWKDKNDNPTIGIILCREKDPTIVRYSVLQESQQLFAAKYQLNLPTNGIEDRVQEAFNRLF